MNFLSDNTAPAAPEVLAALGRANEGHASAYGNDPLTRAAQDALCALFEREAEVFFVGSGTAANAIALAAITPPWGAVLCHREAHIMQDECGAPEFFSGGAKLLLLEGEGAKIGEPALAAALNEPGRDVHRNAIAALSLTQPTERGAAYAPNEVSALAALAKSKGLFVHMDGARFANAVAHFGCSPAELTWRAGVDVLSFGATKNGAFAAEAIIAFSGAARENLARIRKRGGHLLSKHRFIAAQMLAYAESDLWLRLARHANACAARIAEAAGARLSNPRQSNVVIVSLSANERERLRAQGFQFYDWNAHEARFVASWNQDEAGVDALCTALREVVQ